MNGYRVWTEPGFGACWTMERHKAHLLYLVFGRDVACALAHILKNDKWPPDREDIARATERAE